METIIYIYAWKTNAQKSRFLSAIKNTIEWLI